VTDDLVVALVELRGKPGIAKGREGVGGDGDFAVLAYGN
jgi:hypothetical protein